MQTSIVHLDDFAFSMMKVPFRVYRKGHRGYCQLSPVHAGPAWRTHPTLRRSAPWSSGLPQKNLQLQERATPEANHRSGGLNHTGAAPIDSLLSWTMAITANPRSVSDATRFTATTPHATSKTASSTAAAEPPSRFAIPKRSPIQPPSGSAPRETPEQRVARLRAAHDAARRASVSRFDRVAAVTRNVFDKAHTVTVTGLIGITCMSPLPPSLSVTMRMLPYRSPPLGERAARPDGAKEATQLTPLPVLAGFATIFAGVDMWTRNRKRKAEFFETQLRLEADSLEAARLAYMRGDASPEQVALVDEMRAREKAARAGTADGAFKMPGILSAPAPVVKPAVDAAAEAEKAKAPARWLSLEEKQASVADIKERARAAFEAEKLNQQRGGPLDRVGLEEKTESKSSWFRWSR